MNENVFDSAFTTGLLVAAVLFTTILVVPIIRYVVLVAATCTIVIIYLHGGVSELVSYVNDAQTEMVRKLTFSAGSIAGVLMVALIGLRTRRRRGAE
jgi:hypothetical protein